MMKKKLWSSLKSYGKFRKISHSKELIALLLLLFAVIIRIKLKGLASSC